MGTQKEPVWIMGVKHWHCPKCEQDKLPEEFHPYRKSKNGLYCYCKPCQVAIVTAYNSRKAKKHQETLRKLARLNREELQRVKKEAASSFV